MKYFYCLFDHIYHLVAGGQFVFAILMVIKYRPNYLRGRGVLEPSKVS